MPLAFDDPRPADVHRELRIQVREHALDVPANLVVHAHVHVHAGRHAADQRDGDAELEHVPARVDDAGERWFCAFRGSAPKRSADARDPVRGRRRISMAQHGSRIVVAAASGGQGSRGSCGDR